MKKYHEIKQLIKPEMIEAGRQVFVAMAWVDTVKPIVKGYQQKILDELKPVVSDKWPEAGKPITLEKTLRYIWKDKSRKWPKQG
jgi:hypothetical protein